MTNQQTKILNVIRRGPTNRRAIADALGLGYVASIVADLDFLESQDLIRCALNVSGNHVRALHIPKGMTCRLTTTKKAN